MMEELAPTSITEEVVEFNLGFNSLKRDSEDVGLAEELKRSQLPPFKEFELVTIHVEQDFRNYDKSQEGDEFKPLPHVGSDWADMDHDGWILSFSLIQLLRRIDAIP